MTTDDKLDLLLELVADIYTVAERLAPKVGLELIRPEVLDAWLRDQAQKRG